MRKPLVTAALAFLAGIYLGNAFLYFPCTIAASLLLAAAATAWRLRLQGLPVGASALLAAAVLSGMVGWVLSATTLPQNHYKNLVPLDGSLHVVDGSIVSALERDPGRTAFLLDLERIDDRPARGRIRVVLRDERPQVGHGDRISVPGKLYPLRGSRNPGGFDYPAYLGRQGVFAVLSAGKASPRIRERGSGPFRMIQDWREHIRQAFLEETTGAGAALLQAMILGEEGGLTDDLRDVFLAAGATHILSISGSHLGLVAIICFWIARNLLLLLPERLYHRVTIAVDPRKCAALLAVLPVIFYALLAGGQQATIRSLIMLLAGIAALLADRDHDLPQALAIAGLIVLMPAPQAAFDISFQLSYLSVAAILFVVQTAAVAQAPALSRRGRIMRDALLLLSVSLATTLATAPLVVFYFNRISPWGILSNMFIVPFAGFVVVPLGLLSGVLSLALGSIPFAGLNQLAGDAFASVTAFFAALPGATQAFPAPSPFAACSYAVLVGSLAAFVRSRILFRHQPLGHSARPSRTTLLAAAASAFLLVVAIVLPSVGAHKARVTFLDVGQGDCALVETAGGRKILIDGGGAPDNRFDTGRKVVAPFLWNRNIGTIDLAILSHPHPDHMNGLASVLRSFAVREVWTSGRDRDLEGYDDFLRAAEHQGTLVRMVRSGDRASVGTAEIEVLHPADDFAGAGRHAYEAENNRSLVVRVTVNGKRLLFPGDIHRETERSLAYSGADLRSDLLKVPHHGSKTSSTDAFLASVAPAVAVVSVGAGNPYRQPATEVIERLLGSGARVFRTDRYGAVIVPLDAGSMAVVPWASLLLEPLGTSAQESWWNLERENWERLWIRTMVI